MKKKEELKAMFSQRLIAFILDVIIVSFISSIVVAFIPVNNSTKKLYDEQEKIMTNYMEQKISIKQYINQLVDVTYEISRNVVPDSIISIVIALIFFVIYPFYHNGQTIGKTILKIRVKKCNDSELTMNDLLFRAMINHNILIEIIFVVLIIFASKDVYIISSNLLSILQYIVLITSLFMIAFTKKRQAIHDKLVHTEVVCVNTVMIEERDEVRCES